MMNVTQHKRELISMLGEVQGSKILECGCGRGEFLQLLFNADSKPRLIYAVDSSAKTINLINANFAMEIEGGILTTQVAYQPDSLKGEKFDKIICHNVLECVENKVGFINAFENLLTDDGIFLLSHIDFDSAIFNSNYKEFTRELIHFFADTKQDWQEHCDGQMGRKIPGFIGQSIFKGKATCKTLRIVETELSSDNYGPIMAEIVLSVAQSHFDAERLDAWYQDLKDQYASGQYYFAIDLVVAIINKGWL